MWVVENKGPGCVSMINTMVVTTDVSVNLTIVVVYTCVWGIAFTPIFFGCIQESSSQRSHGHRHGSSKAGKSIILPYKYASRLLRGSCVAERFSLCVFL